MFKNQTEPLAISVTEAARLLSVSRPTVYQLLQREDFPVLHLGRRTLIPLEGLKEWVRKEAEMSETTYCW